jgi:hypothetical protein
VRLAGGALCYLLKLQAFNKFYRKFFGINYLDCYFGGGISGNAVFVYIRQKTDGIESFCLFGMKTKERRKIPRHRML